MTTEAQLRVAEDRLKMIRMALDRLNEQMACKT
jgi:hypothetical protein